MNGMMKKSLILLLSLILCPIFSIFSNANEIDRNVVDNNKLLSDEQSDNIEQMIANVSEKYGIDIVIHTEKSTYGVKIYNYAKEFYIENGYGVGEKRDGIILVISGRVGSGEYYILPFGKAAEIFDNDNVFDDVENNVSSALSNGDYYKAMEKFVLLTEKAFEKESLNKPYFSSTSVAISVVVVLILALSSATITLVVLIKSMNNARPRKNAKDYVRNGSFNLQVSRDVYLYSTITKRPRVQSNKRSGGNISFGGRGGRGGRF